MPDSKVNSLKAEASGSENLIRVEFHCHTKYSKDSLAEPEALIETCQLKGIDRLIVTDHNTIDGALAAQALDPQRVIVGEEIMTTAGELLASFVMEEVPKGLAPLEAVERLREQGAFISISHPFDIFRTPWDRSALLEILPYLDAIETFNARCLWKRFNKQAAAFAHEHDLPGTSGSDAHTVEELGAGTLRLPVFSNAAELRVAIRASESIETLSSPWVHFWSTWAKNKKVKPAPKI